MFALLNIMLFGYINSYLSELIKMDIINSNLQSASYVFFAVLIASGLRLGELTIKHYQSSKTSELDLLKSQLNPHFLFNTLNNMYGLAVMKSDKLPGLMLRLSELLRYSIYECNEVYVPIKKEIDFISNYLELERLRIDDLGLEFSIIGNISNQKIMSLILITFIENIFKHYGRTSSGIAIIKVKIQVKENELLLFTENLKKVTKSDNIGGLGIKNTLLRLDYNYPKQYSLNITNHDEWFKLTFKMPLK